MTGFDEKRWRTELDHFRSRKDEWMRTSGHSPMPHEFRHQSVGLDYFPPDSRYRFVLRLRRYPEAEKLRMTTSKGAEQEYVRYGYFDLPLEGGAHRIHVYKSVPSHEHGHSHEQESLFIPFRDGTSGKESYGAARYIELEEGSSDEYVLDFNLAYNPYCAYNDDYVCPFPPLENWLKVPISAGEKTFRK